MDNRLVFKGCSPGCSIGLSHAPDCPVAHSSEERRIVELEAEVARLTLALNMANGVERSTGDVSGAGEAR